MAFKIDQFLDIVDADKATRQQLIELHDNLYAAHEIVRVVASTTDHEMLSERAVLAVFGQLCANKRQG